MPIKSETSIELPDNEPAASLPNVNLDLVCDMGCHVARKIMLLIQCNVRDDPARAFQETVREGKKALEIDIVAERMCETLIHTFKNSKFRKWVFYGEESLNKRDTDLSSVKEICVLADAVDGTDLLERGLSNWCSGFTFFQPSAPPGKKILASFVALPSGEVYHARCDKKGAFVSRGEQTSEVAGVSKVTKLAKASICFYGQKLANLKSVVDNERLQRIEDHAKTLRKKPSLRIYNLAGIPMLMKLIDHRVKNAKSIDAVFEIEGQKPHDFVPGAYIVLKAGAIVRSLKDGKVGADISFEELEELLLQPASSEVFYVVASTKALAKSLTELLQAIPKSADEKRGKNRKSHS